MADFEVGSFTPEQTRLLWQDYLTRKQLQPQLQQNYPQRRDIVDPPAHRVFVKNTSIEEIPAFGCMQVTGAVTEAGRVLVTVSKPSNSCSEYFFNSPYKIASGGYGWGYSWGIVRMLGTASAYTACKRYTATAGSWSVTEGPGPFLVYGADETIAGTVVGRIVGDRCKAKFILFDYEAGGSNSVVTPIEFFDGTNPCGTVEVEYPLGEPCTDTQVIAFYDANTDKYQAIATPNAMLGTPVTRDLLITELTSDSICSIGYTKQSAKIITCDTEPEPDSISLSTVPVQVMTDLTYVGNSERKHYTDVYVCGFSAEYTEDIPGAVCCTGQTNWTWNYALQEWTQGSSTCSEGCVPVEPPLPVDYDDPSSNGTEATTDCEPAP